MKPLIKFSNHHNINFVGYKNLNFAISGFAIILTFILLAVKGLNYGIDFQGGYLLELRAEQPISIEQVRAQLHSVGNITIQEFGDPRDLLIKLVKPANAEATSTAAINQLKQEIAKAVPGAIEYRRIDVVGPTVGSELLVNCVYAVFFALLSMLIYIWIRFEWQFGLCAILSLVHDCISIVLFYAIFQMEFNLTAMVAILLTAGYSINDTVVIYDRIRENLRRYKKKPFPELFNLSINETLSRTILTSGTTLLALVILWLFGGSVIAAYSLPIIVGISVGTYSSICVAAPLLLSFNLNAIRNKGEASNQIANDL